MYFSTFPGHSPSCYCTHTIEKAKGSIRDLEKVSVSSVCSNLSCFCTLNETMHFEYWVADNGSVFEVDLTDHKFNALDVETKQTLLNMKNVVDTNADIENAYTVPSFGEIASQCAQFSVSRKRGTANKKSDYRKTSINNNEHRGQEIATDIFGPIPAGNGLKEWVAIFMNMKTRDVDIIFHSTKGDYYKALDLQLKVYTIQTLM